MTEPIIPGFYPDPSICRVGDDYYLATSSFEYFPAVPIFHSTDLVTWTQLGNALDRPTQLEIEPGSASGGIFAPTLRHHDGRFWLITTNVSAARNGHLIITADDPAGPWSDPVFTDELIGIDPDLTWDADGTCYLTWSSYEPELTGIAQVAIDPSTGRVLGEPRLLWTGTGLAWPESPHLYRVGDWWYLLIAEGGTERGHSISVARARDIHGPFDGAEGNPIFSHRSTASPVQNTGHGDLVQTTSGGWAMVYLAARPRGITPGFHVNGRETFLAGIDWVDDWPVIDEHRYVVPPAETDFSDGFTALDMAAEWITPGDPIDHWSHRDADGRLILEAGETARESSRILAVRTRDAEWTADATLDTTSGVGRMVLRLDDEHWCSIIADETDVTAVLSIKPGVLELAKVPRTRGDSIHLWMSTSVPESAHNAPVGPDTIHMGFTDGDESISVASLDGRYLSTEVAGGFTGRVVGVSPDRGQLAIRSFGYRATRR